MHVAVVSACLFSALLVWPALGLLALVCSLLATGIAVIAFTLYIRRKLAGHTGDTLGAAQQISEIAAFCALATAL
jgi:adenosylcobinamide-GDP ribazoletransferase